MSNTTIIQSKQTLKGDLMTWGVVTFHSTKGIAMQGLKSVIILLLFCFGIQHVVSSNSEIKVTTDPENVIAKACPPDR
jgi:hypothetical protein